MRVYETINGYENKAYIMRHMPFKERTWKEEDYNRFERRYLNINLLDNDCLLEIISVWYVIDHPDIARYTEIIGCAFIQIEKKSVLAVDLRDNKTNKGNVPVVIAEARLEGNIILFGFIIDRVDDFWGKVNSSQESVVT